MPLGPFAVVHGGTTLGEQALVEEHTVVGMPELGYAVNRIYPGAGGGTTIGAGAVIRAGVVVYADVQIGVNALVSHGTLLRIPCRSARKLSSGGFAEFAGPVDAGPERTGDGGVDDLGGGPAVVGWWGEGEGCGDEDAAVAAASVLFVGVDVFDYAAPHPRAHPSRTPTSPPTPDTGPGRLIGSRPARRARCMAAAWQPRQSSRPGEKPAT